MDKSHIQELIQRAIDQMRFSYVPYSNFRVGAALLTKDGKIYTGCNIENAAYGPTNCAERTAFFKAVSEGERQFDAICIVGGPDGVLKDYTAPCGVCRQVMMEFCNPETFQIILAVSTEDYRIYTLKELLPLGFGPDNLDGHMMYGMMGRSCTHTIINGRLLYHILPIQLAIDQYYERQMDMADLALEQHKAKQRLAALERKECASGC